jgi:hypothetical protein
MSRLTSYLVSNITIEESVIQVLHRCKINDPRLIIRRVTVKLNTAIACIF